MRPAYTRQRAILKAVLKFGSYAPVDRADKMACLRLADRGVLVRMWNSDQPVYIISEQHQKRLTRT
jgi:alpha-D-ribose 1-methylphosphonate 5-triphosphate synthase subunit PhnH